MRIMVAIITLLLLGSAVSAVDVIQFSGCIEEPIVTSTPSLISQPSGPSGPSSFGAKNIRVILNNNSQIKNITINGKEVEVDMANFPNDTIDPIMPNVSACGTLPLIEFSKEQELNFVQKLQLFIEKIFISLRATL